MASGKPDIWWEIKTPSAGWRPVSIEGIEKLPKLMAVELNKAVAELADMLVAEIKFGFHAAIRGGKGYRARNPSHPWSNKMILMQRMIPALTKAIIADSQVVSAYVFDMSYMSRVTTGEGHGSFGYGWFYKFTDGHNGRAHGSLKFGFITLAYAKRLAEKCISAFKLNDKEASELRQRVSTEFKGKHNEGDGEDGIMVELNKPLFFDHPQFGKARKYVRPHPGFEAWHVLENVKAQVKGGLGRDLIMDAMERAFDNLE